MTENPRQIEQRTWTHLSPEYLLFETLLAQKNSVQMFEELKEKEKESPDSVNIYWMKWENLVAKKGKKDSKFLSFFQRNKMTFTTDAGAETNQRMETATNHQLDCAFQIGTKIKEFHRTHCPN